MEGDFIKKNCCGATFGHNPGCRERGRRSIRETDLSEILTQNTALTARLKEADAVINHFWYIAKRDTGTEGYLKARDYLSKYGEGKAES